MSRVLWFFVAILLALPGAAQSHLLLGQVIDSDTNAGLSGATVLLKSDTTIIAGCVTTQDGRFQLNKSSTNDYAIEVKSIGYPSKTVRFIGSAINPAPLRILLPGFCPYAYIRGQTPSCIGGHTNRIVPIAYGLPSAKTMEKAKKGKLHLGGCELSGCDPMYYCLLHERAL